jgi:prepilin-type processing-associated H-X9-DG protein
MNTTGSCSADACAAASPIGLTPLQTGQIHASRLQELFCLIQHKLSGHSGAGNMVFFDVSQDLLLALQTSFSFADSTLGLQQRMLKGTFSIGHPASR